MTTLLITGLSSYWGQRVAAALGQQKDEGLRLLGLDHKPPTAEIPGLEFIRSNLNNPLTLDLLTAENVGTVLHLSPPVMAGDNFLTLCAEAGVKRIIIHSQTAVYGAYPTNPLYIPETHPLDPKPHSTFRSLVEMESFANGLAAQYPELGFTILRFAHILGPTAETPLARFLLNDRTPTLLGFNPLYQLIHEEDVVTALVHAALNEIPGVYNIATEDPLPLNKVLALAGKLHLPLAHPVAAQLPSSLLPIPLDYLRYPCLARLDRMNNEFGFTPTHTAEETVTEFATEVRKTRYMPDALDAITNPLRDFIQRLTRSREEE